MTKAMQIEAMALLEQTAGRGDLRMDYDLQPGDIQFIHNHTILHARSAFEDWQDEKDGGKRHLLRTWISPPNGRSAHILPNTHCLFAQAFCATCSIILLVANLQTFVFKS